MHAVDNILTGERNLFARQDTPGGRIAPFLLEVIFAVADHLIVLPGRGATGRRAKTPRAFVAVFSARAIIPRSPLLVGYGFIVFMTRHVNGCIRIVGVRALSHIAGSGDKRRVRLVRIEDDIAAAAYPRMIGAKLGKGTRTPGTGSDVLWREDKV